MLAVVHGRVLGLGILGDAGVGSGSLATGRGLHLCSLAVVVGGMA